MAQAQGTLNLFFDVVDNPWRRLRDSFFFVDFQSHTQLFCFGRIVIDLFFGETIDVGIVDSDHESVIRLGQEVNPNFWERGKTAEGNGKGKKLVLWAVLPSTDDMLAHLQLGELSVRV